MPLPKQLLKSRPHGAREVGVGQEQGSIEGAVGRCFVFSKALWRKRRLSRLRAQKQALLACKPRRVNIAQRGADAR